MSYVTHLTCLECGATHDVTPFRYFCPGCGGCLDVEYDFERMARDLRPEMFTARRGPIFEQWFEFLPIEKPELIRRVTLGEAPTPMVRGQGLPGPAGRNEVWFKNETLLPTCSLKDRSMPLTILKALEFGRQTVGIVSSGNAAASLAAYAARAGLRALVFLKADAPPSKLFKTMLYRPTAIQVEAGYGATEALFAQARDEFDFFDCDGMVNPYRIEGKKTLAYEVARDFGWQAPAALFVPTGYGSGAVAAWKGFQELRRLGFIDRVPAIVAVQPAVCAPIARAFDLGLPAVEPVPEVESVAEAVVAGDPVIGGRRVLEAVRASRGMVVAVSEEEIGQAVRVLAETQGIAAEPTGAIALAGLLKVDREGSPFAGGRQVVSVTGHALNSPRPGAVPDAVRVPADYAAVARTVAGLFRS